MKDPVAQVIQTTDFEELESIIDQWRPPSDVALNKGGRLQERGLFAIHAKQTKITLKGDK